MALVRILVDGYSLLHRWPELAAGKARHSEAAREELVEKLKHYQDATGTPITVFFDGQSGLGTRAAPKKGHVEVLYSRTGQTADQMIERVTHLFKPFGEVMAVTDDAAERDTVVNMGGTICRCSNFIRMVEDVLADITEDIKEHNRAERNRFNRRRE